MAEWAELRVHGVSGTPPKAMLPSTEGDPRPFPLAGRSVAYRPVDQDGHEKPGPEGQLLEAFHWGAHTSGHASQAYWLLLLPFGMVNAAQFMLPCGAGLLARALRAVAGGALRVLALVLTVLFVLAMSVGALDLAAWQWAARARWVPDGAEPAVLAVAIGICVGAVVWLSRRGRTGPSVAEMLTGAGSREEAEQRGPAEQRGAADQRGTALEDPFARPGLLEPARPPGFSSPDFFAGDPDAPTLRRLHVSAGVLVVAYLGWSVAVEFVPQGAGSFAGRAVDWTGWALALVAVVTALLGDAPGAAVRAPDAAPSIWGKGAVWVSWLLLAAAAVSAVAAAAAVVLQGSGDAGRGGALPAVDGVVVVVAGTGLAAQTVFFVAVVLLGPATPESSAIPRVFRRFAHGWAAALVAGLGLFVGVGFTAAATYGAQVGIGLLPGPSVRITPLLQRVAFAWGVVAVVFVVMAVVVWAWVRSRSRHHGAVADRTCLLSGRPPLDEAAKRRIGMAMAVARIKSLVQIVLLLVAVVGAVLAAAMVVEQVWERCEERACPPGDVAGFLGQLSAVAEAEGATVTFFTVAGVAVLVALGLALLWIAHKAFQGSETRRAVNVVWDVIAFWPRAAHPFVPEPYSQDVVPALVTRIETLLGEQGSDSRVVVAAHSQGSLVALAALRSLDPELCRRVGVLTFGSQLRLLFPRAFPAHVGYRVVDWLRERFGDRWVSLYRETDHIGGPVAGWGRTEPDASLSSCRLGEGDRRLADYTDDESMRRESGREWRLFDPPLDPVTGIPAGDLRKHSDYWLDRSWPLAVARALSGARVRDDQ